MNYMILIFGFTWVCLTRLVDSFTSSMQLLPDGSRSLGPTGMPVPEWQRAHAAAQPEHAALQQEKASLAAATNSWPATPLGSSPGRHTSEMRDGVVAGQQVSPDGSKGRLAPVTWVHELPGAALALPELSEVAKHGIGDSQSLSDGTMFAIMFVIILVPLFCSVSLISWEVSKAAAAAPLGDCYARELKIGSSEVRSETPEEAGHQAAESAEPRPAASTALPSTSARGASGEEAHVLRAPSPRGADDSSSDP